MGAVLLGITQDYDSFGLALGLCMGGDSPSPCLLLRAGLLLYLLDVTFRCAQQAQPVHVTKAQPCRSATLATLHFDADPFTPIKPVQARAAARIRHAT
jgi:hypothetical protein